MALKTSFRTCPLCEATCGLTVEHDDNRVARVRGDRDDVFSKGFICPKGAALGALNDDPDRLTRPMIRDGDQWRTVDWDEAFAAVRAGLEPIRAQHGPNAVGVYLGNPSAHNLSGTLYNRPLLKALGTRNVFSASTVDQMPKHVSSGLMFGAPLTIPVPDVDRTDFVLMLGANPWVSNGSLATAPDWPGRLRALRRRGGRLVVVDPVRTQTADHADLHVAVRPGADAWLLAAMIHTLFEDGRIRLGRLDGFTNGVDALRAAVRPFGPDRVAARCGVDADVIRNLARDFAAAERAVCYGRIGTTAQRFGSLASWLIDALNAVTGRLDAPGGAMFPTPAHEPHRPGRAPGGRGFTTGRWHSRVRGAPEVLGELPVATLADEILTEGEGQVRALVTVAGNPVLSTPDGARLTEALGRLDFMVSLDPYLNETTRFAHVILPPSRPLQRSHYDALFYALSVRNVANYSPPAMPLSAGSRSEWHVMLRLIGDLAGAGADVEAVDDFICRQVVARELKDPESPLRGRAVEDIMAALGDRQGPERLLDFMLRAGAYGAGFEGVDLQPARAASEAGPSGSAKPGLSLQTLIDHPHGIDLGPLQPRLPGALRTPSGRVELAPAPLVNDLRRLETALDEAGPALVLVGRRHLRSNNSWMHNVPGLMSGRPRCTAQLHPDDARAAGLGDGDLARIKSATGALLIPVQIDPRMRRGVVSVPHGWGHDDARTRQSVARMTPGVNANRLVSAQDVDPLSGTAVLNGVAVSVAPA